MNFGMDNLKKKEERLIKFGVKKLKESGFKDVNEKNIFINQIYATAFRQILKTQLQFSKGQDSGSRDLIQKMITEIRIKSKESKHKIERIKNGR